MKIRKSLVARIRTPFATVWLAVAAASPFRLSACGLDWSPPTNHFDGVDEQGYVEYWEKVADVDFGDGLKLPMEIGFRSHYENGAPSPYLGAGWVIPLLEANFVQTGENSFEMLQPDGWTNLFLRKDTTTLNGSAGWMAQINGDTITAWARCGWKIQFYKGHIVSMTTPKNRTFEFVYSGDMVTAIRENGATRLGVEQDTHEKVMALVFDNRRLEITKDQKPRVQKIAGQNLLAGMDESLKSISPSVGPDKTFEFAVSDKIQPTLKITSDTVKDRLFTWDPSTKKIVNGPSANAAIRRANGIKQSEYWFHDDLKGCETTETIDGSQTIRKWFVGGAPSGMFRSSETYLNGSLIGFEKCSYDYDGTLLRVTRKNSVINYSHGKPITVFRDGKLVWQVNYDKNGLVTYLNHYTIE